MTMIFAVIFSSSSSEHRNTVLNGTLLKKHYIFIVTVQYACRITTVVPHR